MDKKEILSKLQPYKALHPKMYELIEEVIESHPEVDKENIPRPPKEMMDKPEYAEIKEMYKIWEDRHLNG